MQKQQGRCVLLHLLQTLSPGAVLVRAPEKLKGRWRQKLSAQLVWHHNMDHPRTWWMRWLGPKPPWWGILITVNGLQEGSGEAPSPSLQHAVLRKASLNIKSVALNSYSSMVKEETKNVRTQGIVYLSSDLARLTASRKSSYVERQTHQNPQDTVPNVLMS